MARKTSKKTKNEDKSNDNNNTATQGDSDKKAPKVKKVAGKTLALGSFQDAELNLGDNEAWRNEAGSFLRSISEVSTAVARKDVSAIAFILRCMDCEADFAIDDHAISAKIIFGALANNKATEKKKNVTRVQAVLRDGLGVIKSGNSLLSREDRAAITMELRRSYQIAMILNWASSRTTVSYNDTSITVGDVKEIQVQPGQKTIKKHVSEYAADKFGDVAVQTFGKHGAHSMADLRTLASKVYSPPKKRGATGEQETVDVQFATELGKWSREKLDNTDKVLQLAMTETVRLEQIRNVEDKMRASTREALTGLLSALHQYFGGNKGAALALRNDKLADKK